MTGRSPHIVIRPEQIDVRLADVVGIDVVKDEVVRSLQPVPVPPQLRPRDGRPAAPRPALRGRPGTGKTYTAKAMAAEAGVPFLFVSGDVVPVHASRAPPRARSASTSGRCARPPASDGGAIGFIDEFDAIGLARGGGRGDDARRPRPPRSSAAAAAAASRACRCPARAPRRRRSTSAVRRRQRPADGGQRAARADAVLRRAQPAARSCVGKLVDTVNLLLPAAPPAARRRAGQHANILLIASTNRADSLDPALLRPGRFDRRLTFELPAKTGRRQLIDHFLARKAHAPELDADERRDALAAVTQGYSPAMLEHLLDEALVKAVRASRHRDDLGRRRARPAARSRSGSASRSTTPTTRSG